MGIGDRFRRKRFPVAVSRRRRRGCRDVGVGDGEADGGEGGGDLPGVGGELDGDEAAGAGLVGGDGDEVGGRGDPYVPSCSNRHRRVGASRAAVASGGSAEVNRRLVGAVRSFGGGVSSVTRSGLPSHRVGRVPGSTGNAEGTAPAVAARVRMTPPSGRVNRTRPSVGSMPMSKRPRWWARWW